MNNSSSYIKNIFIIILLIYFLFACKEKDSPYFKDNISITSFNVNWLGDGKNDLLNRAEQDYKNISYILEDLNSDIFCLQEVENGKAIQKLLKYLPEYKFIITNKGRTQKLAILYKPYIEISEIREIDELMLGTNRHRPAISAYVRFKNFDFKLVNIHLKSTSRYDSTEQLVLESRKIRKKQISILNNWVIDYLNSKKDEDIIIVGDFNDTPKRKINNTLSEILENNKISFITANLKSCGKYKNSYVIDNFAVSLPVLNRLLPKSVYKYDIYSAFSVKEAKKISDHCPITASFDTTMPDND